VKLISVWKQNLLPSKKIELLKLLLKKIIFEKWNGRIAQAITDFTMEPCVCNQKTSLQNLSKLLNGYKPTQTIVVPSSFLSNYCVLH